MIFFLLKIEFDRGSISCLLFFFQIKNSSAVSKLNNNPIASWDTKFEMGTKTILLQPFSPIVVAADENERIRYECFLIFFSCRRFLVDYVVAQDRNS